MPVEPTHALFCWDGKPKTQKPRPPKPPSFTRDLKRFKDTLPHLVGGAHVTPNTEADDAVATAAFKLSSAGIRCTVVSADKDLHQLASELVDYYCINHREVMTVQAILEKWGVRHPSEVGVALALLGDKSDGVSGVHGLGPVKVKKLFAKLSSAPGDLMGVIDEIGKTLSEGDLTDFYTSLEVTCLNVNLDGIPDPAPITLSPVETLTEHGLDTARLTWARLLGRCQLDRDVESTFDQSE